MKVETATISREEITKEVIGTNKIRATDTLMKGIGAVVMMMIVKGKEAETVGIIINLEYSDQERQFNLGQITSK